MATALRRATSGVTADRSRIEALRQKLSQASGGNISAKLRHSNELVVERYSGKVKNRGTAIRAKCMDCSAGIPSEVSGCRIDTCALHPFRMGSDPFRQARAAGAEAPTLRIVSDHPVLVRYCERVRNRATSIRAKCMQCMNGQPHMVAECQSTACALHPFRMGKDPFHSRSKIEGDEGEEEPDAEDDEGDEAEQV